MEKLVWSIEANNDLIEIYNYISNDSSYNASKTVYDIIKKTRNLERSIRFSLRFDAVRIFLKACKETRSFKDVMNCLFFCPYDTRIRTYVL